MKTHLLSLLARTVGMATIGVAQASEPVVLSERQMGQVTAGSTMVVTSGDVLASVAELQQSGSLPISVLDVQALLNGLQMGQVTAGSTMVVTSGDSITFTITSTPIVAF